MPKGPKTKSKDVLGMAEVLDLLQQDQPMKVNATVGATKYNWPLLTMGALMIYMAIQSKNQPAIMMAVENLLYHLGIPKPPNWPGR